MDNIQNFLNMTKNLNNTGTQHFLNMTKNKNDTGTKISSSVRGIENEYEDNPEDNLEIVPENKQKASFIPGYVPRSISAGTPTASNVTGGVLLNGIGTISNGNTTNRTSGIVMTDQLDDTRHYVKGKGILASRKDMQVDPDEFADGCKLLQACALGNIQGMHSLLKLRPHHINFRDYDRRTALHVAASEGKLNMVMELVHNYNAAINRSDRWGGSALDDACRHRHSEVIQYLRSKGASTGSTDINANVITAAAAGDIDDLEVLLSGIELSIFFNGTSTSSKAVSPLKKNSKVDINGTDYDGRTALHLSSAAGHVKVVRFLISKGADVNVVDHWGGRPLDDAIRMSRVACIRLLQSHGAKSGKGEHIGESSGRNRNKEDKNLKVEFSELDVIDKIGSGAFGEIFKCKWRGTLVAAKCIKNTKIVEVFREDPDNITSVRSTEEGDMNDEEVADALSDFREETAILRTLRHPNICMLLGYSATQNFEVMISELMKCSLLDVFRSDIINHTRMSKKKQILYAHQLAMGMNYLHKCTPPVIHRDLKPANLLIDGFGTLKISDFGLAKVRPDPKTMEIDQFRMTGETGSYRFMAPEVFRHENYTETVDVYSFAMILYYLLAGRPPWQHLSGLKAVIKAATEADRPILDRSWDNQLGGLMQRCWDENPTFRPPFSVIIQEIEDYSKSVLNFDMNNISLNDDDRRCCTSKCVIM